MEPYVIILLSVVVLSAGVAGTIYSRAKKEYKCPVCSRIFKPRINNWIRFLLNFPAGGCALRCPFCNEKHIMKEYDDRES